MLGIGLQELLIIGVLLIVVIGTIVGVVMLVVSLMRRREPIPVRAKCSAEPDAKPGEARDRR